MKRKQIKAIVTLSIITIIWGATFPLIKSMMKYISPEMIIVYRFMFAAIIALPAFIIGIRKNKKVLLKLILLGGILYIAYFAQTVGIKYTTASKSGFITGLYVIFTPIFAIFIIKEKPTFKLIISFIASMIGLALLSGISIRNFSLNKGDLITIFCAIAYALQVVLTKIYAKDIDLNFITATQMISVFIFSLPFAIHHPILKLPPWVWISLAFMGCVASYLAILAETYSLKYLDPDRVAIIFTLEPVFAGISSFIFLKETLSKNGILGAILIIFAMWLALTSKTQVA